MPSLSLHQSRGSSSCMLHIMELLHAVKYSGCEFQVLGIRLYVSNTIYTVHLVDIKFGELVCDINWRVEDNAYI